MMEARIPSEKEEDLQTVIRKNQDRIDAKDYRSEREKDEILSRIKDATMKLEAIKATRTIGSSFHNCPRNLLSITS